MGLTGPCLLAGFLCGKDKKWAAAPHVLPCCACSRSDLGYLEGQPRAGASAGKAALPNVCVVWPSG